MYHILFVNGNLHGHINPTIPIVTELVEHGVRVYYFSTKEFRQKLEAAGAIFMDYGDEFDLFLQSFRPSGNHPFYTLMEYILAFNRKVIPIILSKTKGISFHAILHDAMFGGGDVIAKKLNLPAIASCSSFVMEHPPLPSYMLQSGFHPQLDTFLSRLKVAETEWNTSPLQISDVFFKKEAMNLVYTSRKFQPQGDNYDNSYHFVGPSIKDRSEVIDFPLSNEGKLIYISLGTINNGSTCFYETCFEAFSCSDDQVIMSVGNKIDITAFSQIPDNFIVRNYIPQLEVLKHTDVFISHGGLNSVSEALNYGVPVIAIPIANDQPAVARRLSELGAGLELKLDKITPTVLKNAVSTILHDQSYQINCGRIKESFHHAGGYQKAVHDILEYINA